MFSISELYDEWKVNQKRTAFIGNNFVMKVVRVNRGYFSITAILYVI